MKVWAFMPALGHSENNFFFMAAGQYWLGKIKCKNSLSDPKHIQQVSMKFKNIVALNSALTECLPQPIVT